MLRAEFNSEPSVFKVLLEAGAEVNAQAPSNGWTPLHVAAQYISEVEVFKVLLDAGAEVDKTNNQGRTPLHVAAEFNSEPGVFKVLLDAGAEVNAQVPSSLYLCGSVWRTTKV